MTAGPSATSVEEHTEAPPLSNHRLVRAGAYSWAVIGLLAVTYALFTVLGRLTVVVVPLVLALFPATVLAPGVRWLVRRKTPPAIAALMGLVALIGLLTALFAFLVPQVQQELGALGRNLQEGYTQVEQFLANGPLGFAPIELGSLIEQAQQRLAQSEGLAGNVLEFANLVVEGFAGILLMLFALFFYLKDGQRIGAWLRSLFPATAQDDAEVVGGIVWLTIGGYIRGQLLVALVDAVFIGLGLVILRVPLALPLAVLVFFGGLFPIVGAVLSGTVAVLVALATNGLTSALLVLALVLAVQQLESHLLAPIVLGRATQMHPLAVVAALTAGGVLLGVLGAFLGVPVAASIARAVNYLRQRTGPAAVLVE
jgi:predicted PurR-regulated permease PerM